MIIAQLIHAMAYHQLIKCLSHYSPEWLAYTQREAQANLAAGTVILYNPPPLTCRRIASESSLIHNMPG